ncbi:MAG: hypothetical protein KAT91_03010, partial [Candidatus Aenigmarchaeota archaeon]|nr:hypothetical protein [Candidatus Aenigmarchaeota archaeon]
VAYSPESALHVSFAMQLIDGLGAYKGGWSMLPIEYVAYAGCGAMSQFKCAYTQKKPVFAPCPDFKIEPFEGIFNLINERRIMPVRNADEFLAKITGLKKKHVFQSTLAQAKPSGRNSHKLVTA